MGQRFWHVITTELATPISFGYQSSLLASDHDMLCSALLGIIGTEATKLLRPWLFWANFEVHSGLLTDTIKNLAGDDHVSIQHCLDLI